ncbi:hypothetical protein DSO57_1019289 [Entomophthora muscae]|uniref:Uncharacterized protein n=1 Tax=Entomophthora muscae TaxID=34485 RepID=A0ACC2S5Z2_9FUNG|nr:hypothetical protein DSO57_1019289 [Entomophthora muscae]
MACGMNKQSFAVEEGAREEAAEGLQNKPLKYKAMALVVALFFSIGSHYASNSINALKGQAKKELGMSNTTYGVVQASVYLINTVMPIVGGVLMDRFGSVYGAVVSNGVIFLGNVLVAISASFIGSSTGLGLMISGRVLHGFGSGMIVVAQQTILSKWFSTSILGTVIGIQIAASRFSNWLAHFTAPQVAVYFGTVQAPLWVSACMCALSLGVTLLYAVVLHHAGGEVISAKAKRAPFSPRRLTLLPLGFWVVPLTYAAIACLSKPFMGSVAEFIKMTYPSKKATELENHVIAGFKSSVALLLPIIISPLLGGALDWYGHRSITVIMSATILALSFACLPLGEASLYPGLVLFSIGKCIGPVATISSVPLLLSNELVGTGIGINKSAAAISVAFMHLLIGLVQDTTPQKDYSRVLPMLFYLSILGIFISLLYYFYNYYNYQLFDAPARSRKQIIDKHNDTLIVNKSVADLPPPKLAQYIPPIITLLLIAACWLSFIYCLFIGKTYVKKLGK